jgi:hypothetical protein
MNEIFYLKITRIINKKTISIELKDSYYFLPFNLRTLGISYNVDDQKGVFPHTFVNKSRTHYEGILPDYKHYKDFLSNDEYLKFKNNYYGDNKLFNVKNECLLYLEKDLKCLHSVMSKFSEFVFNT